MGNHLVQQLPFVIQPGDSFRTYCNYGNMGKNSSFGFGSYNEMCMVFIFYYPQQSYLDMVPWACGVNIEFPPCESEYHSTALENAPHIFGADLTDNDSNASNTLSQGKAAGTMCHSAGNDHSSTLSSVASSSSSSPNMFSGHWHLPVITAVAIVVMTCIMESF